MPYPNGTTGMTKERPAPAAIRALAPELLFLLLVVTVFADPLFTRRNFAGRDLLPYHLAMEHEIHDAWSRGALPLWTNRVSGGRPLLPNPNLGALYPVRPLLGAISFPAAFRIYPVLHWLVAGLGLMRLIRSLGCGVPAAWVGGVSYAFSGVGMSEVFYTNIQPGMAILPWILWAAVRPARSRAARVLPLAILTAVDVLAGDVFTIGIAVAGCALGILLETAPADRAREAASLAGALGLALLLAAPQIVASALWAPLTHRAVVGLRLNVATAFSLPPWRLLELLVPYPFGATWSLDPSRVWGRVLARNFFSTLFCGGLAVLAVPILRRHPLRGARLAAAGGLAAAALCVAPWFLPAAWGDWRSPIPLRYPEKFAVGLAFALALGAGLAVEAIRRGARLPRGRMAAGIALAAVAAAGLLVPAATGAAAAALFRSPGAAASETGREIGIAFLEGAVLWAATLAGVALLRGRRRVALPAAVLLLTAVPLFANRRIARAFPEEAVFSPTAFARSVAASDPAGAFRTLDASRYRAPSPLDAAEQARDPGGNAFYRGSWFLYTPCLWNRGVVLNADPDVGDFSRMESLRRVSALFPSAENGAALFSSLSLSRAVRFRDQAALPGFHPVGGDGLQIWDENPSALPSLRLAASWREARGPVDALSALARLAPGEIVIETEERGRPDGPLSGGTLSDVDDRPERLRFTSATPSPSWVFVLRGFWPYRDVRVDGRRVDPVPALLAFSAIPVPAGTHSVDWREELPGGGVSWLGPVMFLAAAGVLLARGARSGASSRPA